MTFATRSRDIAADFLQTVIIVDDLARLRSTGAESAAAPTADATGPPVVTPAAGEAGRATAQPAPAGELALTEPTREQVKAAEEDADSDDLDAKQVTDGFAEHGLVCAVLKPDPTESLQLAETPAFKKADIVVLDWVLHKDHGDVALQIIESLLKSDPDRLRLIAIYTGQHDLLQIVERIVKSVEGYLAETPVSRPDGFTVQKGPARIVVYAKPKARIPVENAEAHARLTDWTALPTRLISDFATMTSGLVPHLAVASLSALRKNTHRILRRVSQPLDAAYLWHRAAQSEPTDAEDHLKSIVVEEVASVLDDEHVESAANIAAIEDWLAVHIPSDDYQARFALGLPRTRADAVNLLTHGTASGTAESNAAKAAFHTLAGNAHTKTAGRQCFASSVAEQDTAQANFAALLSIRTRYSSPPPILTLGTIVRITEGADTRYWVCVQPVCDSVRLSAATAFPLLPLTVSTDRFDLVLAPPGQPSLRLRLKEKPLNLRMITFAPNTGARGVVEAERDGTTWHFSDAEGARYEWLAELKPHHALRLADMLSGEMRRVGLSESEWLRLWSNRR